MAVKRGGWEITKAWFPIKGTHQKRAVEASVAAQGNAMRLIMLGRIMSR
jgi:hypothetical protein